MREIVKRVGSRLSAGVIACVAWAASLAGPVSLPVIAPAAAVITTTATVLSVDVVQAQGEDTEVTAADFDAGQFVNDVDITGQLSNMMTNLSPQMKFVFKVMFVLLLIAIVWKWTRRGCKTA